MDVLFAYPRNRLARGYTLVELSVALAVSAALVGIAAPALHGLLADNRLHTQVNGLIGDLMLSRSEAIKRRRPVVVCASRDGATCTRHGNWHEGWIVFADTNDSRQRDGDEALLRVRDPLGGGSDVRYRAFGSRHYLVYFPLGLTNTNGTFVFCHRDSPPRGVILSKTGRPRASRTRADGSPLPCPDA